MICVALVLGLFSVDSPVGMLHHWRRARLDRFKHELHERFGSSSGMGMRSAAGFIHGRKAVEYRYHVHVLIVDESGGQARLAAAILESIADAANAGRFVRPTCASLAPARGSAGIDMKRDLMATGERLGLDVSAFEQPAASLRPRDMRAGGGFDLVLCTDLEVLEQVRRSGTEGKAAEMLSAFCLADFLLSTADADGTTDVASITPDAARLPQSLRSLLDGASAQAADQGGAVACRCDLPRASPAMEAAWDEFLVAATMCAVGFTAHLRHAIGAHAHEAYVRDLQTRFSVVDSLLPWPQAELHLARGSLSGGLSEAERRQAYEAHAAALRLSASLREPATAPSAEGTSRTVTSDREGFGNNATDAFNA